MEKSSGKTKKPKSTPRRDPDARREQNRIASRNYREKRKQKLTLLNQILDTEITNSAGPSSLSESPNANQNHDFSVQANIIGLPESHATPIDEMLDLDLADIDGHVSTGIDTAQISMLDGWVTFMAPASLSMTPNVLYTLPRTSPANALATSSSDALLPLLHGASLQFPQETTKSSGSPDDDDEAVRDVLKGIEHLSINQKRGLIQLLQYQVESTSISTPSSTFSHQHFTSDLNVAKLSHRTRLQLEALEFSIALRLTATAGPSCGPSEYARSSGLFSALFANCMALGMPDIQPLLIEDGWSIFGLGPEIGYHPSQLSVVRAKFRNLAPDLQPCDKQLTFAHHPYIDVIPFKAFRENILKALDHDPPLLDEDVLCYDMLGGLICWGSRYNTQGMDAAVPWDVRSWEPSIWFLSKYRDFVGGWNDEMWNGARWWHRMRGERIQYASTVTSP